MDAEHRLVRAVSAQKRHGAFDHVQIGLVGVAPENIHVELPELAQAAALRALVAVHVGDGKPFERVVEFTHFARHHARHRGRHLGADRKAAPPAVGKVIGLFFGKFLAAFGGVDIERFQHRPAVFLKASRFQHLAHLAEKPVAQFHFAGIEIPRAFVGQNGQFGCFHVQDPLCDRNHIDYSIFLSACP